MDGRYVKMIGSAELNNNPLGNRDSGGMFVRQDDVCIKREPNQLTEQDGG